MAILLAFSCFIRMHSNDVQGNHLIPNLAEYQSECMRNFIQPNFAFPEEHQNILWQYLCADRPRTNNPCRWRGVACTNEVMTNFFILGMHGMIPPGARTFQVNPNWLPSTLENVHLDSLDLSEIIEFRKLPRELRYFHSHDIIALNDEIRSRTIELRWLPRKLEEFIIFSGRFHATLFIADLPPNMRLLFFRSLSLPYAYVNMRNLPKSLKNVVLNGDYKKCKVRSIDGSALDYPFAHAYCDLNTISERYSSFSRQLQYTVREMREP